MEYPLIRSRRKTVGIYIRPDGSFEVRAPLRLSKARIDEFVHAKEDWIREKSALVREREEERHREAQAMPRTLPLLGAERPILPGSPARLEDGSFVLPGPGPPEVRAQAAAVCRALAKDTLPGRVSYWAQQTGLFPTSVRIGSARTSWGCCSGKNAVTLSWRLITASPACIDYVIVHELCHTADHNHSPRFWARVASFLPDWKERRTELAVLAQELARRNF